MRNVSAHGDVASACQRLSAAAGLGAKASNKPIEVPACEVFRVEGEKIKSSSHYFDMLTLLKQIGAMEGAALCKERSIG